MVPNPMVRAWNVKECKSTRVQKLTKMQKKFEPSYAECVQQIICTSHGTFTF